MAQPDVSSSEIPPHAGQVTHDLSCALHKLRQLRDAAIARSDGAGAEAWTVAADLASRTVEQVAVARLKQTWGAKRTELCPACKR